MPNSKANRQFYRAKRGEPMLAIRGGDILEADRGTGAAHLSRSVQFYPEHLRQVLDEMFEPIIIHPALSKSPRGDDLEAAARRARLQGDAQAAA